MRRRDRDCSLSAGSNTDPGDPERADDTFSRARQVDPDNPNTLYGFGRFALESLEIGEASDALCKARGMATIDAAVAQSIDGLIAKHEMTCPTSASAGEVPPILLELLAKAKGLQQRVQGCDNADAKATVDEVMDEVNKRIAARDASDGPEFSAALDEFAAAVEACRSGRTGE